MEIKMSCDCGQKFKFDVEPINGEMPFTVNCPSCGTDSTSAANAVLANTVSTAPATPNAATPRLQLSKALPVSAPPREAPAYAVRTVTPPAPAVSTAAKPKGEFNLGLGSLGAILGAGLGMALMYGFYQLLGFRFPLLGVGIGVLTGFGAKLLYKGTDNSLGFISGGVALVAVVGTLFLMYGEFPLVSIISVLVSVSVAYRLASG